MALTLVNVWLAAKEDIWCWPTGIASVVLYGIVFWREHLFANAALQVVYFVLSIHGWYEWLHGGANKSELRVRKTRPRTMLICIIAVGLLTYPIMRILLRTQSPSFPFWDASTTAVSLVGQWMMNEKLLENWLFWLIVDVVYVPLFWAQKLLPTAVLYVVLCVIAWKGYVDWKRSMAADESLAVAAA